ncbi:MarR family transcriptional regulator [Leuconostoc gelidum subsp. aenigmaticum]|uniref:MarR family transcriptional regulator n=1 Tax=Leuconostoc gelidum TaxID=1244 RepID=UPI001CC343BA|nr:helix-turn-helix domain-containing protein [Leuconostoc gelidum]MBZ6009125.1 MarR family transcriptional regulator [Leuconostoc gelidum subsp. aenigmaticum]
MSENLKTIRELADELGVSKQRIQQIIAKLSTNKVPNKEGNKYVLNQKDVHNIKVLMGIENDKSTTIKMENRVVDYDVYLDTIESMKEKDEQIKSLLEVQKQTQNLLDQQQRLALQDKKMLEEYKSEIKNLKSLNMPSQVVEKDETVEKNIKEASKTKHRKWWQPWI